MTKFLIPNATGPTNIGDHAILMPVLKMIDKYRSKSEIILHTSEKDKYRRERFVGQIKRTLYDWAVFENRDALTRAKRVSLLILNYFGIKSMNPRELDILLGDYENADQIICVGGGYLRSQKGLTQSLNLLMILFMFQIARRSNANKIMAPISFGPFAYIWQERLSARIIKDFDLVMTRESISYQKLQGYKISNLTKASDTAFLLSLPKQKKSSQKGFTLGFTIRKWLDKKGQKKFEDSFVSAVIRFSKDMNLIVQPIIQVDAPEYGDFDDEISKKVSLALMKSGVEVFKPRKIVDLETSIQVYTEIDLLLGMRMHSNILAALSRTPFVAISYEHKTDGISKDLGVEDYCIKVEEVNEKNLYEMLMKAYKNRSKLKKTLEISIKKIRGREIKKWSKIFRHM